MGTVALDGGHLCPLLSGVMFTELAYVKEKLRGAEKSVWHECAKVSGVHFRTISRIVYDETIPGSDTVGKIAMYFRTKEKRRKAA